MDIIFLSLSLSRALLIYSIEKKQIFYCKIFPSIKKQIILKMNLIEILLKFTKWR